MRYLHVESTYSNCHVIRDVYAPRSNISTQTRLHLHLHVLQPATMNRLIVWLLLCLTIFSSSTLASILAIDYGAEWIKAVLLAPGQPFDILLDKSSKRKVQSSVGWKRDDRLFGSDALAIVRVFSFVVARTSLLRACMRTCSRSRSSRAFGECDAPTCCVMIAGTFGAIEHC